MADPYTVRAAALAAMRQGPDGRLPHSDTAAAIFDQVAAMLRKARRVRARGDADSPAGVAVLVEGARIWHRYARHHAAP